MGTGAWLALLDDIATDAFHVEDLVLADYRRVRELCDRYADADIGFVDACPPQAGLSADADPVACLRGILTPYVVRPRGALGPSTGARQQYRIR